MSFCKIVYFCTNNGVLRMKRVVFFLMVLFAFSCDVAPQIEISPEKYVVEAEGGIVYFTATASTLVNIDWSRTGSSDETEPVRSVVEGVLTLDGGWYQIQLDRAHPKTIVATVSENVSSEQRSVCFGCEDVLGGYVSFHAVI